MINSISQAQPPRFLKILSHDLRWKVLTALTHSDMCGQELVAMLNEPQNLVSYHLRRLRDSHLITERRSSADRRDVYYSIDLEQLRNLYFSAAEALHPALSVAHPEQSDGAAPEGNQSGKPPVRVLFLCTHNSARSQMAEAIMRHLGGSSVEVFSAGSLPSGVHPYAASVMQDIGIDISGQRSKHLDEFSSENFDYIITVCDRVREGCPVFPGDPAQIHWSFLDPTSVEGEEARYEAFVQTAQGLASRIRFLLVVIEKNRMGYDKLV